MNKGTFHRLPRSAMAPLRITAWLQSPVLSDNYLPIDGVLYYEAMRRRYGDQYLTTPGGMHPAAVPGTQLPLARREEHGPMWYYAASFAQWSEPIARGQDHWNRRVDMSLVDLVDWQGRKSRIDVASGAYKSFHMPIYYRHSLSVVWYVVGQQEEIERLLSQITNVGKKISQGWGAILKWKIEEIDDDWSVRGAKGQLMRPVPSDHGVQVGFRPSYWLPKNQTICEVPE